MRAPFAPPRLSEPRKVDADAQAVDTSCETVRPEASTFAFSEAMSCVVDQRVIDRGNRVLPDEFFGRHFRPEVTRARTHVTVRQLEPGPGERVGQLIRVLHEAPRNLFVRRIEAQRKIRGQHRRRQLLRCDRCACGIVAPAPLATHCCAPAGLFVSSHS